MRLLRSTPSSTRRALAASVGLAVVSTAAACGTGGAQSGQEDKTITVAGFGGSFEDAQAATVVEEFEERYDAKVVYRAESSSAVMAKLKVQKARSGYDVVQFSGGQEQQAYEMGLLEDFDETTIPNAKHAVAGAERNEGKTPPAYALNTTGIIYNTETVSEPPQSWNDLTTDRYAHQLGIDDISQAAGINLLLSLAKTNEGSDKNVEPGFDRLEKLVPEVAAIYQDATEMTQLMTSGQIDMAVFDSGYAYLLQKKGLPVKFAIPEGSVLYGLTANVVSGSNNTALAQKFINTMHDPEIQIEFAQRAGYAPTNTKVDMAKDMQEKIPLLQNLDNTWTYDPAVVEANREDWSHRWAKIIAAD